MTFIQWLETQDNNYSMFGSFAHDVLNDYSFPSSDNYQGMKDYLTHSNIDSRALEFFEWTYGVYLEQKGGNHEKELRN